MNPTPTDRAAELLRLRERATAGNWWHDKGQVRTDIGGSPVGRVGLVIWQGVRGYQPEERIANGEFVAYAANHAAAIVTALQQQIADARLLARAMMTHEIFSVSNGTVLVIQDCETSRQDLYPCTFDADGLPILTDEVRAALRKAIGET